MRRIFVRFPAPETKTPPMRMRARPWVQVVVENPSGARLRAPAARSEHGTQSGSGSARMMNDRFCLLAFGVASSRTRLIIKRVRDLGERLLVVDEVDEARRVVEPEA